MKLLSKFNIIPYVGLATNGNLGDEHLFNLSREYLSNTISLTGPHHGIKDLLRTATKRKYVVGGGSLLLSDYLFSSMKRWSSLGLTPYFFGTGSRELDSGLTKTDAWKNLLGNAKKDIWVRGELTKNRLMELGISSRVSGDPGFMLNLDFAEPFARQNYVLVSARLITHGKLAIDDAKSISGLELFLNRLQKKNVKLIFFSAAREDEGINAYLAEKYSSTTAHYSQNWKELLGQSRLVITSRMHPGIFGLALGKPVMFLDTRCKYKDSLSYYHGKSALVSDFSEPDLQNVLDFYEESENISKERFYEVRLLAEKQKLIFSHLLD